MKFRSIIHQLVERFSNFGCSLAYEEIGELCDGKIRVYGDLDGEDDSRAENYLGIMSNSLELLRINEGSLYKHLMSKHHKFFVSEKRFPVALEYFHISQCFFVNLNSMYVVPDAELYEVLSILIVCELYQADQIENHGYEINSQEDIHRLYELGEKACFEYSEGLTGSVSNNFRYIWDEYRKSFIRPLRL